VTGGTPNATPATPPRDLVDLGEGGRVSGFVEDGYGRALDAFIANFVDRGDVGAACTIYREGRVVVDLWGGIADPRTGRAWGPNTAAVIFSCSKGLLSICAYLLAQAGRLELDVPIARYWPEFGRHGKDAITVRHAMSHRAGLPMLDRDLSRDEVIAWDPVIAAIEEQRPLHLPAAGHFYHAQTFGWILGEVIRRVTGLTPGQFIREALGDRLGLRTWIGLPPEARASVAFMLPPLPDESSEAAREAARLATASPAVERSLSMGGAFPFPVDDEYVSFNDPALQAAEIPASNGISNAHSLARLYGACVSGIDGPQLLDPAGIADALRVQSAGPQLSGLPDDGARWGTGFQLSSAPSQPMLGPASLGHAGAGGQLAYADAEHRIGFAYLSNQMGGYGDARARELTLALRASLGA